MGEIKYKVTIDDSEARKQLKEFLKLTSGEGAKGKSIIDFSATQKEMQGLLDKLEQVQDKVSSYGKNKSQQSPITDKDIATLQQALVNMSDLSDASAHLYLRYADLKAQSDSLTSAKKALANQLQAGEITLDQYTKSLAALSKGQLTVGSSVQQLNREIKQSIQLEGVQAGSLEEARIKYNQLTAAIVKAGGAMDGTNPAINEQIARHQALRKELDAMEQKLGMYQRNVGNYASGWNSLQNSINQLSRELPAFTYSIQTGFMAISNNLPIFFDDVKKAADANKVLAAEGKKGVPVWKQLVGGVFSLQTALSVGITLLTVYGKEIGEWIKSLMGASKGLDQVKESQRLLNKGFEDSSLSNAIQDIDKLRIAVKMAKDGFVSKKAVVEEYNSSIGKTTGEVKTLDQVERFLISNADNYIKMMLYKAAANKALEEAATSAIEAEKTRMKELSAFEKTFDKRTPVGLGTSGYVSETDIKNAKNNARRFAEARKAEELKVSEDAEKKQLSISNNFLQKAQQFASKMKISVFGDDPKKDDKSVERIENIYDRISKSRTDMQNKILDLDKEYARKRMQSDEAEIQALKDKFSEFKRIVEQENEKISKVNNKYKGQKGYKNIPLLDTTQLGPIEDRAIADTIYKQDTTKIEKDLEEKKRVFAAYEDDLIKLGKEKADQRYKNDLGGFKTYKEYLNNLISKDADAVNAVTAKTADAGQQARVKIYQKESKDIVVAEQKKQSEVLALMVTYDQKRKIMVSEYEAERKKQVSTATAEELAEFDKRFLEELNQFDDANAQKLEQFKNLFNGIERLTDSQAKKVISDLQKLIDAGVNISPELLKRVKEALKDATKSLDERLPARVMQVANAFSQLGSEISSVNAGLGTMLSAIGDILAATIQVSDNFQLLTKGLENYKTWKNDKDKQGGSGSGILGGISAIAGLVGPIGGIVAGVATVATGVFKFFGAAKESAKQAEKQLKDYYEKILSGELEYNRLIRERARSQGSVNDMTLKELQIQKQLLETQLKTDKLRDLSYDKIVKSQKFGNTTINDIERIDRKEILTDYEYALQKILQEGTEVTGQRKEKYGGFLGLGKKTRLVDVTTSLAGKTYEDLEKLYTEGKMNEATRALFENLQKAKTEVDDINELMKEIDETIKDKMSGSIQASSISDNIIQGFKDGKRAVSDFADSAEDIIRNALLSAMSATVLEEPLRELVAKFREDAKDGLSEDEINQFKAGYSAIVQSGLDSLKEVEKVTGVTSGSGTSGGLSGAIKREMTEATASELTGLYRSTYDLMKRTFIENQAQGSTLSQQTEIASSSLNALNSIQNNTFETVRRLDMAVGELQSINKNLGGKYSSSSAFNGKSMRAYTGP